VSRRWPRANSRARAGDRQRTITKGTRSRGVPGLNRTRPPFVCNGRIQLVGIAVGMSVGVTVSAGRSAQQPACVPRLRGEVRCRGLAPRKTFASERESPRRIVSVWVGAGGSRRSRLCPQLCPSRCQNRVKPCRAVPDANEKPAGKLRACQRISLPVRDYESTALPLSYVGASSILDGYGPPVKARRPERARKRAHWPQPAAGSRPGGRPD